MTIDDLSIKKDPEKTEALDKTMLELQRKFGGNIIKNGNEIIAEKRFKE